MLKRVVLISGFIITAGCVENAELPTVPEQILPVTIVASDRSLDPGESTTLTVTITNTLDEAVQLAFPNSCQALVFIRNASGRVFTPEGGTWECASVPSFLTIQPADSAVFNLVWGGGVEFGAPGTSARVPAGRYFASAEFRAEGYHAVAFPISIDVN